MAARKLQQEVDKCFKKVGEGVAEFEAIYEKIEQSNNPAQKDKLEDNLKREIKKLQRLRDQIKTWAASNDIKDKAPLLEHRRLIETQMEKFKAVEKAMKTKAYSKEGLSAAAKLDPKEQAKAEVSEFLSGMVDELEQQIESMEAESEGIQATMKKGKGQAAKAERIAEIERVIERHKWHQGKLELIRRSLDNGGVDVEQVNDLEESIRYYVSDGMNDDFMEDDTMYDDLALDENEENFGMHQENDRVSSQDTQSVPDEPVEPEVRPPPIATGKPKTQSDALASSQTRRPSTQIKSPMPTLATLQNPLPTINSSNASNTSGMKPASVPTRPAGEGLKYASAAAAAAASDKNGVGIAPLPPPPGSAPVNLPSHPKSTPSAANSPSPAAAQPASSSQQAEKAIAASSQHPSPAPSKVQIVKASSKSASKVPAAPTPAESAKSSQTNGVTNGNAAAARREVEPEPEPEPIYHLPASLQDLVDSFEATKKRPTALSSPTTLRMLAHSQSTQPEVVDSEAPHTYRPEIPFHTSSHYPQEPLAILDDPRLYARIDPDTLFYVFYYKQGTNQQYLAAKSLKDQSWRFHKQYQTWFQRHEEPKSITEEFEQGTYRFFDYESTWMNRRKADFKFAYKFLEDDV